MSDERHVLTLTSFNRAQFSQYLDRGIEWGPYEQNTDIIFQFYEIRWRYCTTITKFRINSRYSSVISFDFALSTTKISITSSLSGSLTALQVIKQPSHFNLMVKHISVSLHTNLHIFFMHSIVSLERKLLGPSSRPRNKKRKSTVNTYTASKVLKNVLVSFIHFSFI